MSLLTSPTVEYSAFDFASDIGGKRVGIGPHTQMHMIRLNSQFEQPPGVVPDHLLDDVLQSGVHRADQYLAPSFRTPDDVVDHQMHIMTFVLILHFDNLPSINEKYKLLPPILSASKGTAVHPWHE